MDEFTIQDVQKLEFDILKYIKKVCDENKINYYLAYGTLIGAVRHHGFIPWDDDIDIMMPREDFIKFVESTNKDKHDYFKVVCRENNTNFTAPLPKVIDSRTKLTQHYGFIEKVDLGVYVDIFILDGAGGDISSANKWYEESYQLYKKWNRADMEMFAPNLNKVISFVRCVKHIPEKIIGINEWLNRIEKHNSKKSFYKEKYVSALEAGTPEPSRNVWPQEYFGSETTLKFNETEFRVPNNYDFILRSEYGDYMNLPPIEKQQSHHKYDLIWK